MSEYQLKETETTINVKSYSQGYKDGYNAAVKFYIQDPIKNTHPDFYGCRVCGRTGPDAMVCHHPKCPSRITC
ncbi:hypothetical protein UFOVP247_161 [uncultured Caudovirales phage]|uniref:Uncharacterized protein n=1 Tax=uncultured Caudovirales phage TaxID=2100421 RepID=A0A6J7WUG7_9CAUD|nr:hypothetical protein UFOVP247_161 [uncultured Caudovirales phage]